MVFGFELLPLLDRFIYESEKGKHLQKSGARLRAESVQNYKSLRTVLRKFSETKQVQLTIKNLMKCTRKEYIHEKNLWKKKYKMLVSFLYNDCNSYDNYVGNVMKLLRSVFNYLRIEKGIDTRDISRIFYVCKEEIPIVVLSPEKLNKLITDKEFEKSLPLRLQRAKDIFVFGCTTAFRYSDLLRLTCKNVERNFDEWHIKIYSKKTGTFSKIKLPPYAILILKKYWKKYKTLLPMYHLFTFNKYCRELAERAGWTEIVDKCRSKQGKIKLIKKNASNAHYRFCDLITSHTMRKTAITTFLSLGMPEQLVRRISGHSPGSKEFFRYVKYSDALLDNEINKVHAKFELLNRKFQH